MAGHALIFAPHALDIDHYFLPGVGYWTGVCENFGVAAKKFEALLTKRGFDVTVCAGRKITTYDVLAALEHTTARVHAGDLLVLVDASHGGRVKVGDAEPQDVIALYDRLLFGVEVEARLAPLDPAVRILSIADACHSQADMEDAAGQAAVEGMAQQTERVASVQQHEQQHQQRVTPPLNAYDVGPITDYSRVDVDLQWVVATERNAPVYAQLVDALPRPAAFGPAFIEFAAARCDQSAHMQGRAAPYFSDAFVARAEAAAAPTYRQLFSSVIADVNRDVKAENLLFDQTPCVSTQGNPALLAAFEQQAPFTIAPPP